MKKTIKTAKTSSPAKKIARAAPARKAAMPAEAPGALLEAVAALHSLVQSRLPQPPAGDRALEDSVDSLRRLLSELIEARMDSVARDVAAVRGMAAKARAEGGLLEALDALLEKLGAVRFEARRLDYLDPLIHRAVGERADAGAADGVIVEAVQPGYRTARGSVLSKADVIVNRRN